MLNEVKKTLPVDIAVCAAAVTDLKPAEKSKNKIKKDKLDFKSINFIQNNDILEFISKNNKIDLVSLLVFLQKQKMLSKIPLKNEK